MKIGPLEIRARSVAETRSIENPATPLTTNEILKTIMDAYTTPAGENVTVEKAMRNPAFAAGCNFYAQTIAKLPLDLMQRDNDGNTRKPRSPLHKLVHDQINDDWSSYDWREYGVNCLMKRRRWLTYIERDANDRPINLYPMDPTKVEVKLKGFAKEYRYKIDDNRTRVYQARDVLDIYWHLQEDMISTVTPYDILRNTIGLAIAVENYGAGYFKNGGMPPMALFGDFDTGKAVTRASEDVERAMKQAQEKGRNVLPLPNNHKLEKLAFEPEKGQMIDVQRFIIEQMARGFNLPPVFLQDLTHGTFSNTEQQDLHLVKHSLSGLIRKIEAEINLKFFKRGDNKRFIEFNMDGLLRGDLKNRMEAYAKAIQNSISTPAEIRRRENMPFIEGSDRLFIQGATVPLDQAGAQNAPGTPPAANDDEPADDDGGEGDDSAGDNADE
ncbi:phage portal protein [Hyphococcus flavus]|uniref:Phage portal protein n=1 Tax=Hyphococcus flavus TaxID=1866326 RepID=A0AAF0CEN7_9PROT|nr:phage portal protein [Hyphococcus flavus]WDI31601.1 phage portal protein [Hyphococcus flavus]